MSKTIWKISFLAMILGLALVLTGCGETSPVSQLLSVTFMSHDNVELQTLFVTPGAPAPRPFGEPSREGWTFTDWFTQRTGGEVFDFNTPITANTTVWAGWTQTPRTVIFNLQGGNWGLGGNTAVVHQGDPVGMPADPVRNGFFFNGWFNEPVGGTIWDFDTPINENTVLWAQWTRSVRVTFDLSGGNLNTPPPPCILYTSRHNA